MRHSLKRSSLLLFLIGALLLTGCWDQKDIDTRGYVLGLAIDSYPPDPQSSESTGPNQASPQEEEKLEKMQLHTGEPGYAMTIQLPILANADMPEGPGIQSAEGSQSWEITQIGNSFFSINREMASRTGLSLYYEHLQVLILSEEVARKGLINILDMFMREPEMRRGIKVMICPGEAKSILDVVPRIDKYSSVYLSGIFDNSSRNSRMVYHTNMGDVICALHDGHDFVLAKVISTKDENKASGGAVFHNGRMAGWATEMEVEAINLIRNTYEGGVITVDTPKGEEGRVAMEITNEKAEITPIVNGDQVSFRIDIKVEGDYSEDINLHTHEKLSEPFLKSLEAEYEKEIQDLCTETIESMQEKFKADVFQFDRILQAGEPAYWERMGSDWNSIYPDVGVTVHADVHIILTGI